MEKLNFFANCVWHTIIHITFPKFLCMSRFFGKLTLGPDGPSGPVSPGGPFEPCKTNVNVFYSPQTHNKHTIKFALITFTAHCSASVGFPKSFRLILFLNPAAQNYHVWIKNEAPLSYDWPAGQNQPTTTEWKVQQD